MVPVTFPQAHPLKVYCCIPNMGHTEPLAYDNRLVWFMRQGAREERARWVHALHRSTFDAESLQVLIESVTGQPYDRVVAEHQTWYEFYSTTVGEILTPFARELLTEKAIEGGADLIFMVDDDMVGDPNTFFRLAETVVHGPADLCGALAFTRGAPNRPVLYRQVTGFDMETHKPFVKNRAVERYPKDSLVECDAVGFGAVVFTAALARRMTPPRFMNTTGSGEDIFFCYKAREECGARIFSDTRVKLGHMGYKPVVNEEDYEAQASTLASRARGDELAALTDPPTWGAMR